MIRNELTEDLRRVLAINPSIEAIMTKRGTLDEKRLELVSYLSETLIAIFDHADTIPPLEWVLCRDSVRVFRNILSHRSEELAGFSVLEFIDTLMKNEAPYRVALLTRGFVTEIEHLVRGVSGKAGIYSDDPPAFLELEGPAAAIKRSDYLSSMARDSDKLMTRYPCGLDDDLIRIRSSNKEVIKRYFNVSDLEWNDWGWHTRNIIRNSDVLADLVKVSDQEIAGVRQTRSNRIPFGVTPYYLSLFDRQNMRVYDKAIRAQVLPPPDYVAAMRKSKDTKGCSMDFMLERDTTPIEGITRRYPNIVILKPVLTCPQICVYCQRNWEIEDVYSNDAAMPSEKLDKAIEWIENTPEINEVLITGGDPFIFTDEKLDELLARIASIEHVIRIRIGTRTFVTLPQRITDALVRTVTRYHEPGRREILLITHFEHQAEITPEAMTAVQKFRLFGVSVYNQMVYTFYNSKRFEATALRQKLRLIGVTPYYTFNTKGKEETDGYRVPIARLLQEQHEEARLLPGTVRTDEIVFNVPKLGKNYLRASQHRDMISVLPNGCRTYEFHPWEKQLALMDTYIYVDVPISDYLERLEKEGENLEDYKTIWYYY